MLFLAVALRLLLLVSMPSIFDEGADAIRRDGAIVMDERLLLNASCH